MKMNFVNKCKKLVCDCVSSKRLHGVAPQGCLYVYVGAEREKFVIKIKMANHPLFKALLDPIEREYDYTNDGPLWFPCHVDLFREALTEMENTQQDDMSLLKVNCLRR